ncbi:hypothetical protein [Bacillus alkalicellulosilyticus]|nr:hypothetical protein [Bacillus alkalicellulosilyticus]
MNQSLSTFLKIGITAVAIGILLFGVGFTLITGETTFYNTQITGVQNDLP